MRKPKQLPLELHKGCKNCSAHCQFNKPVTTKFKNQQAPNNKYGCNTTKGKVLKVLIK